MTIVRRLPPAAKVSSAPAAALLVVLALAHLPACQNTDDLLKPGDVDVDVLRAVYIPDSVFQTNPIELNGEALEQEWGGPLDLDLPFHQIRVSTEHGAGDAGEPTYVAAKCIYTDSDIYFLFRWSDPEADELSDPLIYVGPDFAVGDSCAAYLTSPLSWIRASDEFQEDQFVVQFAMPDVEGASLGRRDVWQWLACRTNVVRNIYSLDENPFFPIRGFPGYMEDALFDPEFGLFFDPGSPPWRRNFQGDTDRPTFVYRPGNDPFFEPPDGDECRNGFGGECQVNNGLAFYYLWREDGAAATDPFASCDTTNFFPRNLRDDGDDGEPRAWRQFDAVTGYWYTYPEGSRADVRAKAQWVQGVWTLETGRALRTGDTANDLVLDVVTGDETTFTVQVYDRSATVYRGSGPQRLLFGGPRDAGRPAPSGRES